MTGVSRRCASRAAKNAVESTDRSGVSSVKAGSKPRAIPETRVRRRRELSHATVATGCPEIEVTVLDAGDATISVDGQWYSMGVEAQEVPYV